MRTRGARLPQGRTGRRAGFLLRITVLIGFLVIVPVGQVQAASAPGSAFAAALEALALTPDDLSQPTHFFPSDPWRLPVVERLLTHPVEAAATARGLAGAFASSAGSLARQVERAAEALDVAVQRRPPSRTVSLERFFLEARKAMGLPAGPRTAAALRRRIRALPNGLRSTIAHILTAQRDALGLLREAYRDLSNEDAVNLTQWLKALAEGREDADDPANARGLALAARIDLSKVFAAARVVAAAVDRALPHLKAAARDRRIPHGRDALLLDEPTPWGRVIIGGTGPNTYRQDALLLVDLGGDDEYLGGAGGTGGRPGAVAVAIDVSGNDRYRGSRDMVQGAGVFGIGILVDMEGDDLYEAGSFAQGVGIFGVGLLWDQHGSDRYEAGGWAQGAGAFGIGLLVDGDGDDRYRVRIAGQGFGYVGGLGALLDLAGDDTYEAMGGPADVRQPSHTLSLAQGTGMGLRPHASGGIGLLMDLAGDDHYVADYFGQGVGYWFGLGALVDEGGNDSYRATRYVQGAGIHLAVGVLADGAGNDTYEAFAVAQGCGHDWGIGILVDRAGDDRYHATSLSQGAGSANGAGLLVDVTGRDTFSHEGPDGQGYGNETRGYGSIGALLAGDPEGVALSGNERPLVRRRGNLGIVVAAPGWPSGIPWDPVRATLPPPAGTPRSAAIPAEPGAPESSPDPHLSELLRIAADPEESAEGAQRRTRARRSLLAESGGVPFLGGILRRQDAAIVNAAMEVLEASGGPAAQAMIPLLEDPAPVVRRRAARVLRSLADPSARASLMARALGDSDPLVRGLALEGLEPWGGAEDVRAVLLAALEGDGEWFARLGAARALRGTREPTALRALSWSLADRHYGVRAAARVALAEAGQAAREFLLSWEARPELGLGPLEAIARRQALALLQELDGTQKGGSP